MIHVNNAINNSDETRKVNERMIFEMLNARTIEGYLLIERGKIDFPIAVTSV